MSEFLEDGHPTTVSEFAAGASLDLAEQILDDLGSRKRSWSRLAHLADQLAWITRWAARQDRRS